jgi:hypothetical protein
MNRKIYSLTSTGEKFNFKKGHSCAIKNIQFNTLTINKHIFSRKTEKGYNPKFIQELLDTEKEESIRISSFDDLFS